MLISTFLLLSLGRYLRFYYYHLVDIYVFITITGSICTFLLLSLGRYLRFYYYNWVDIYVFITITGSISTFLLLSLGRYLRFYYYHWVDIYVFITITGSIPLLVDYFSPGISSTLLSLLWHWLGLLDIFIIEIYSS
jgi:hypothetical protein